MTNKVKIERGIRPPKPSATDACEKYPFERLKPGESFLLLKEDEIYGSRLVHEVSRKLKVKLKTRVTKDGRRIWKVS